jgi:tetratricopeptide (TPR) repeat protein/Cdc6-like AAA superfamily ATPase
MNIKFLEQVNTAVTSVRKRDLTALGRHELAKLKLVQQRLKGRVEFADAYIGNVLKDLIVEVIKSLKPSTPENLNEPEWRHYILLRDYIVRGQRWLTVAQRLGLGHTAFYDTRRSAIEPLAMTLWDLEQEVIRRPLAVKHNLPRPPYVYFVRRSDEKGTDYVDRIIGELTHPRAWVVAIYGAPGVGKTTLAYRVAEECRNRELFDAVVWISARQYELIPEDIIPLPQYQYVTSINAILDTIGKTVGNVRKVLTVSSTEEKLAIVRNILLAANCLIVIDNMETLTKDAHKGVFDFLRDLPGPSKALLTSRERHYVGESIVSLPGMEEDEAIKFMRIEAEARRLRSLSEEELQYIHHETSGIPLAMRHALGRMELYGYSAEEAIKPEVEPDKLLDYMFDSTYHMKLDDTEKRILHVVPIFIEPASAEAIRVASSLGETQLTVCLGKLYKLFLVDKVEQDRYEISPHLHRFLQAALNRDSLLDDGTSIADFTHEAYLNLAQYYKKCLEQRDIDQQLVFLKHEKRNILNLLEWCYENGEASLMIDLTWLMGRPLGILGYSNERITWGKRAMESCEVLKDFERAAWVAAYDVGWAYIRSGEIEQGREVLEESLRISRERHHPKVEALALHNLGRLYRNIGENEKAVDCLEESLKIWGNASEPEWIARSMAVLGHLKYELGKLSEARGYLEEALELRNRINHENEVIETLSDLAVVALAQGDEQEAFVFSDQSLFLGQDLPGPGPSYAYTLYRRAAMEAMVENYSKAIDLAKEAFEIYKDFGVKYMAEEVQGFLQWLNSVA